MPMHLYKKIARFAIIVVYADDLNLVRILEEFTKTAKYLKKEFDMKDLGKTKFCLGLQIRISLLEFWFTNLHILRKF